MADRPRSGVYDANDRFTAGDTYDSNGSTASSGGIANVYDFENHLIQKGGVSIVYDGDGNRVSKTVAGLTTTYLVDTQNPTGYELPPSSAHRIMRHQNLLSP